MQRDLDQLVLQLSAAQRGLFTRPQLLRHGVTEDQIEYRLRKKCWWGLHPGIFCLAGHEPDWMSNQLAACLWSRGIASHRAAAMLHDLPGTRSDRLELTTFDTRITSRCGIQVHHTKRMPREHITAAHGIPCTSLERTLLDLGAVVPPPKVAIALDHSLSHGMTTLGSLDFCLFLTARRGRRGCAVLRNLIKQRAALMEVPNSPLETVIFELLVEARLPVPALQHEIYDDHGRFIARPDFVYPERRAVIEGHSHLWHSTPAQHESDKERHLRLVTNGYRILYVTWHDVILAPGPTAYRMETFLAGGEGHVLPPELSGDVRKEW